MYVRRGIRFSLRDKRLFEITEVEITKRLFEITEVEITRVNCTLKIGNVSYIIMFFEMRVYFEVTVFKMLTAGCTFLLRNKKTYLRFILEILLFLELLGHTLYALVTGITVKCD